MDIITDSMDVSLSKLQETENKRCLIVDVVSDSLPFHGLQHAGLPCPSPYPRAFSNAGQVVWYSQLFQNFPLFIVIHTVKGFGIVNKAEIDVFLEVSCFFDVPMDVDNLISGSSAFSKTSLNIWKFMVHVMLKPGLENFEHYFTTV